MLHLLHPTSHFSTIRQSNDDKSKQDTDQEELKQQQQQREEENLRDVMGVISARSSALRSARARKDFALTAAAKRARTSKVCFFY